RVGHVRDRHLADRCVDPRRGRAMNRSPDPLPGLVAPGPTPEGRRPPPRRGHTSSSAPGAAPAAPGAELTPPHADTYTQAVHMGAAFRAAGQYLARHALTSPPFHRD